MFKKINSFFITTILDFIIFCWSYYNLIQKVLLFNVFITYLFICISTVFFLFLFPKIGTKLKHRKSDISTINMVAYPLAILTGLISIGLFRNNLINYFGYLSYISLYLSFNILLSALTFKLFFIKIQIWLKWGDINIK